MLATLTVQSPTMASSSVDHDVFARNSNMAGGPLPRIPRRSVSAGRASSSSTPPSPSSPVRITLQEATPLQNNESSQMPNSWDPNAASASSSSSSSDEDKTRAADASRRSKRIRGVRNSSSPTRRSSRERSDSLTPAPSPIALTTTPIVGIRRKSRPQLPLEFHSPRHVGLESEHGSRHSRQASSLDSAADSTVHLEFASSLMSADRDGPELAAVGPSHRSRPTRIAPPTSTTTTTPSTSSSSTRVGLSSSVSAPAMSSTSAVSKVRSAPLAESPPLVIRKRSGQVVKSSLRSSNSTGGSRGSLSVVTGPSRSKSEPSTPSAKSVHFDARLEQVKLFIAEQKPAAVSRDGSPTDDTDSDFPAFIFGRDNEYEESKNKPRGKLQMQVANLPPVPNLKADVALQELKLGQDGTNIVGRVRLRNLAFQKWLAVRFTFDAWQTTSEVAGKYAESVENDAFDIFTFQVKLNDLLARIEGKTMIMALRYAVAGREIWDNNNGQNYLASFSYAKVMPAWPKRTLPPSKHDSDSEEESSSSATHSSSPSKSSSSSSSTTQIDDLRSRLEKVVQSRDGDRPLALKGGRGSSSPPKNDPFESGASLSSRYDFRDSFKQMRSLSPNARAVRPTHESTHPVPSGSSTIPWPSITPPPSALDDTNFSTPKKIVDMKSRSLGSPRDIGDDTLRPSHLVPAELEETPCPILKPAPPPRASPRNHTRGYFDLEVSGSSASSSVRRTPVGTPRSPVTGDESTPLASPSGSGIGSGRFYSFPPVDAEMQTMRSAQQMFAAGIRDFFAGQENGLASDASTPSISSPSESTSSSDSSVQSPAERLFQSFPAEGDSGVSPTSSYSSFLNRFCFYTGGSNPEMTSPQLPAGHHRSSSESAVDERLSTPSPRSPSPFLRLQDLRAMTITPTQSKDDCAISTGTITPTRSPTCSPPIVAM